MGTNFGTVTLRHFHVKQDQVKGLVLGKIDRFSGACHGKDMVNPTSLILSGALMFRYMGFDAAAVLIEKAVEKTIQDGVVTYDLARQMKETKPVSSSRFGNEVVKRM